MIIRLLEKKYTLGFDFLTLSDIFSSMIFDSHFHITTMLDRGLDATLPSSFLGLECGTEPGDAKERIMAVGKRKDVMLSMGAGPWMLEKEADIDAIICGLKKDIDTYSADAIGECGFDRHWNYGTIEKQRELFLREIELAKDLDLALIVHSRDADEDLLSLLPYFDERTIMHSFSSGVETAERLLDRGAYISFSGNVTYKANSHIRESAVYCPIDRILYETDAPYLSPVPMRGRPNMPEYTEYTLEFLANIKNVDKEELKERAKENFISVLKHSESVVKRDIITL